MPKIKVFEVNKKGTNNKYDKFYKDIPYFCKSFRVVLCGPANSGKTQVLYNILFNKDFMLQLWKKTKGKINAFIPTQDTCIELAEMAKRNKFKPSNFKIHNQWKEEICKKAYDECEKEHPNLFIFDDVSFLSNFSRPQTRNVVDEILCAGRHRNVSAIVLSQKYTHLNENLRANNCTCLILFYGLINKELERIYIENFSSIMEQKDFDKLIKDYLNKRYSFLVFDKKNGVVYDNEFNEININE